MFNHSAGAFVLRGNVFRDRGLLNIFVSSKADAVGEYFLRQPVGQLGKGLHLCWAGDALLEITDQTDADRPLINLVAAYMPPILLFEPSRPISICPLPESMPLPMIK